MKKALLITCSILALTLESCSTYTSYTGLKQEEQRYLQCQTVTNLLDVIVIKSKLDAPTIERLAKIHDTAFHYCTAIGIHSNYYNRELQGMIDELKKINLELNFSN